MIEAMESVYVHHLETMVDGMVQDLYETAERRLIPRRPWVFVRVLPKEQRTASGLTLPETNQNKTVHEGIVLATWEPVTVHRRYQIPDALKKEFCEHYDAEGLEILAVRSFVNYVGTCAVEESHRSELTPGDHVLFPHWAGLPVVGFSDRRYRIVKEYGTENDGVILGRVEGGGTSAETLRKILFDVMSPDVNDDTGLEESVDAVASKLEERYLLVDRTAKSVTLSGS